MINKITIFIVFFFTMLSQKIFSAQIKIEAYGMDEYFK